MVLYKSRLRDGTVGVGLALATDNSDSIPDITYGPQTLNRVISKQSQESAQSIADVALRN